MVGFGNPCAVFWTSNKWIFHLPGIFRVQPFILYFYQQTCYVFTLFSSRLDNLNLKQEEDKTEKIQRWEIWIIRIRELLDKCKEKMKDLKSKGEPQNKKDVKEQIVLAKVRAVYVCMFV